MSLLPVLLRSGVHQQEDRLLLQPGPPALLHLQHLQIVFDRNRRFLNKAELNGIGSPLRTVGSHSGVSTFSSLDRNQDVEQLVFDVNFLKCFVALKKKNKESPSK